MLTTAKKLIMFHSFGPFPAADGVVHLNPAIMGSQAREADIWRITFPLVTAGTLVVRYRDTSPASGLLSVTNAAGWLWFDESVTMDGTKNNAAWLEGGKIRDFLVQKTGVSLATGADFFVNLSAYRYCE